jgi:hypothetical protein
VCTLLAFIDDATGALLQLKFVKSESFLVMVRQPRNIFRDMANQLHSTAIKVVFSRSIRLPTAKQMR